MTEVPVGKPDNKPGGKPSGKPVLHGYWRSTAAYRVRIALALKGIDYTSVAVDLVKDGGDQNRKAYRGINPAGLVPTLVWGEVVLSQSLAICEYLDEVLPTPPLLPRTPAERALARAIAQDIACDVHPLNNLRVQQYLGRVLEVEETSRVEWMHHWMAAGFGAVEQRLAGLPSARETVFAPAAAEGAPADESVRAPGIAELCLVAQAYNADRFDFSLEPYPRVQRIVAHCRGLPAFLAAVPEAQSDAPGGVA